MRLSTVRHPYASLDYAGALTQGESIPPFDVPEWQCAVIVRPIGTAAHDAAGPYPLAPLSASADIQGGLERLRAGGFVTVVLVPDPTSGPAPDMLSTHFSVCRPFKTHLLVDNIGGTYKPTAYHERQINRAFRRCEVTKVQLIEYSNIWTRLYDNLITRHNITGIARFSDRYFTYISGLPNFVTFAAMVNGEVVGMSIWLSYEGIAYNHLNAFSDAGYANGASFALFDTAINSFSDHKLINLGGAAGTVDDIEDGLYRFKNGFANSKVQSMICGEVFDLVAYEELSLGKSNSFFPAYRG